MIAFTSKILEIILRDSDAINAHTDFMASERVTNFLKLYNKI